MQTLVIVNPASAAGRTGARWAALEPHFRQQLGAFDLVMTQRTGHAAEAVRQALVDGPRRVIAVGGDGTNHEVGNGFFDPETLAPLRPDAVFGFVTAGTGCDLGRTVGMPRDSAAAVAWLAQRHPQQTDVLALDLQRDDGSRARRVALNIVTAGVGGLTCKLVNERPKFGATLPFLLAGVEAVVRTRPWRLRLRVSGQASADEGMPLPVDAAGEVTLDARYLVLANARFNGGGMQIARRAQLDDGLLDAITLGAIPDVPLLFATRGFYDGSIALHARARTTRASAIEVALVDAAAAASGDEATALHFEADGEPCGSAPGRVWVLPAALRMLR